jgi:NAD(P)-dependent dehydrogenase (short-subunit alcohol dehydrogenase family)
VVSQHQVARRCLASERPADDRPGKEIALGEHGIRVNAVAPGIVETDMSNFAKTDAGRNFTLAMQALKRVAQPDDIAGAVAFLASDEARWMTGDTIRIDGGSKL